MNLATILADAGGRPWLARLDPRLKIAVVVWFSLLAILVENVAGLSLLTALAALIATGLRMRLQGWLVVVGILGLVAWSTVVSQGLFYPDESTKPLFTLLEPKEVRGIKFPGLRFYQEGAQYGLGQSLRLLAVTLVGLAVCLSTSPERLLAAMAQLRVPVSVGFLTVTTLRFIPLLVSQWSTLRLARRLRGYGLHIWHLATPRAGEVIRAELSLLMPLVAGSVRRATALSTSVSSRGFDPLARRTFYPELRLRARERLALGVLAVTFVLLVLIKSLSWLQATRWLGLNEWTPWLDRLQRWI